MLAELSQFVSPVPVVLVTGLPSAGKTRFVHALQHRLDAWHLPVRASGGPALPADVTVLHVHADTDVEAFVEGDLAGHSSRGAQVVVSVDWESMERSVDRVIEALHTRGLLTPRQER